MTQHILFSSDIDPIAVWRTALHQVRPAVTLVDWREATDPSVFEFALVWKPPPGGLRAYSRLKAIQSLGAGVDQLDLASLPDVPVARLIDPHLRASMVDYAVAAVYRHFRGLDTFERDSRARRWAFVPPPSKADWPIGIMGLGEIGTAIAVTLARQGFPVRGWARSERTLEGVTTFAGIDARDAFLAGTRVLLNVLALTPETTGILNNATLGRLPRGASLINIGRGGHLVEDDLAALLNSGQIAGATLDVLSAEPPAADHPLLGHPQVLVTPHVAGLSSPETALGLVLENFDRALSGRPLLNAVDRGRGY